MLFGLLFLIPRSKASHASCAVKEPLNLSGQINICTNQYLCPNLRTIPYFCDVFYLMKKLLLIFCFAFLAFSCTQQPDLAGFDADAFKQDRGACLNTRKIQANWLKTHKSTWKGVSSNDVEAFLGKPDVHQLADRNQEYYIYYLETGPHCADIKTASSAKSMAFRFSAIGLATEITFQKGIPD